VWGYKACLQRELPLQGCIKGGKSGCGVNQGEGGADGLPHTMYQELLPFISTKA